jgi:hypothetical protein
MPQNREDTVDETKLRLELGGLKIQIINLFQTKQTKSLTEQICETHDLHRSLSRVKNVKNDRMNVLLL